MRQSGNIFGRKWLDCDRCGFQFPVTKMIRQNGRFVCIGEGTAGCADVQGHQYYARRVKIKGREGQDDDPRGNEVVE